MFSGQKTNCILSWHFFLHSFFGGILVRKSQTLAIRYDLQVMILIFEGYRSKNARPRRSVMMYEEGKIVSLAFFSCHLFLRFFLLCLVG